MGKSADMSWTGGSAYRLDDGWASGWVDMREGG